MVSAVKQAKINRYELCLKGCAEAGKVGLRQDDVRVGQGFKISDGSYYEANKLSNDVCELRKMGIAFNGTIEPYRSWDHRTSNYMRYTLAGFDAAKAAVDKINWYRSQRGELPESDEWVEMVLEPFRAERVC